MPSIAEDVATVTRTALVRLLALDKYLLVALRLAMAFIIEARRQAQRWQVQFFLLTAHLKQMSISLPTLATQQAIVDGIEAEQSLVNANRELIVHFEKKIQATLARVWGEDSGGSGNVREDIMVKGCLEQKS